MISDAGVEAALFKVESIHHIHGDQCLCGFKSAVSRDRTKHIMAVTLGVAAPTMTQAAQAEGWRVGYEQGWKDGEESERTGEDYGPHRTNPYRSQA